MGVRHFAIRASSFETRSKWSALRTRWYASLMVRSAAAPSNTIGGNYAARLEP